MKSEFSCIFPKIQAVPCGTLVRNGENFMSDPSVSLQISAVPSLLLELESKYKITVEKGCSCIFFWQTYNLRVSKISSESLFSCMSCPDFQQIWNIIQGSAQTYTITQLQQNLWLSFFDVVWLCWVCGFVGFRFWLLGWILGFCCYSSFLTLYKKNLVEFQLVSLSTSLVNVFVFFFKFRLIIFHSLRNNSHLFMNKSLLCWREKRVFHNEL